MKLPLSLIITMRYAAARNFRKPGFPGRPKYLQIVPMRTDKGVTGSHFRRHLEVQFSSAAATS